MGIMVMALYRPKPGKEAELTACMRDHLPVLRGQGLATDRPSVIFEWVSHAAIEAAHANAVVGKLWTRYSECCDYVTLGDLAEAKAMFPEFELVTT